MRNSRSHKPQEITKESIAKKKTPSQSLRSVLYLLWIQEPKGFKDFDLFYDDYMFKIISHVKKKLV